MFIDICKAVVLGIVEGVTEFLPISSTGHLILVNQAISFDEQFTKLFDVVIQLGAILAVVVLFWEQLWPFGKGKAHIRESFLTWAKSCVGVAPAIVAGALFYSTIEEKLFSPLTVSIALVVGGLVLIFIERQKRTARITSISQIGFGTAIAIGCIQCLGMIPGTSRSAATIIGAMLLGASRTVAAEFSFFLAVPTMVAASAYSLYKHGFALTGTETVILTAGFIASFATALIVVRSFIGWIKKHDFQLFGWYRIALGALVLLLLGN
ncbi:undecaprenyl-diphosphatase [Candidatus Wirthbacteria bacterium CG2_30_54_11]|uniref:Undecaprenyl-diphosphatase n=1 Tax=Candidatus Wirthbacteria bacterium CG2_30_54_11 TaxID=1817892 RepID=A0A1J5IXH5_9BACT|nr:MAG: undecaprenyl-diphosphatase [Candidatus Wirthbacteria bacterium CG2_30_54_11]